MTVDEVEREMRAYQDHWEPTEEPSDEFLDALIAEAIADAIWRAACEDAGLDLYARTDPDEIPW